jgi:hypothetical protein
MALLGEESMKVSIKDGCWDGIMDGSDDGALLGLS